MYRIAICDDEVLQSTLLEKMIDEYMINKNLEVDIDWIDVNKVDTKREDT